MENRSGVEISTKDDGSYLKLMNVRRYFVVFLMLAAELAAMYIIQNVYGFQSLKSALAGVFALSASLVAFFSATTAYIKHLKKEADKKK